MDNCCLKQLSMSRTTGTADEIRWRGEDGSVILRQTELGGFLCVMTQRVRERVSAFGLPEDSVVVLNCDRSGADASCAASAALLRQEGGQAATARISACLRHLHRRNQFARLMHPRSALVASEVESLWVRLIHLLDRELLQMKRVSQSRREARWCSGEDLVILRRDISGEVFCIMPQKTYERIGDIGFPEERLIRV